MISFNFNEGGRFFTMAFNYMNLWLFVALAIPYPWYGKHLRIEYLEEPKVEWHIRYKLFSFGVRKRRASSLDDGLVME